MKRLNLIMRICWLIVAMFTVCTFTVCIGQNSHWAELYMNSLSDNKIMEGFPDGNMYPDKNVTRAEFAKMFVLAANLSDEFNGSLSFSDVNSNHWAYEYVSKAQDIIPNNGSFFHPDDVLTRIDMASSLVYFIQSGNLKSTDITVLFSDISDLTESQMNCLKYAVSHNYINGYPDNSFKPNGTLTRAEAATFLYKVFFDNTSDATPHIRYTKYLSKSAQLAISQNIQGHSLIVENNLRAAHDGLILTPDLKYPLNVTFANLTDADGEYTMKVFYDYEEIAFKVAESYEKEYVFNLDSLSTIGMRMFIDNKICLDNYSHKLTVAIFAGTDQHACDYSTVTDSYGICLDYEIKNPNSSKGYFLNRGYFEEDVPLDIQFSGLIINDNKSEESIKLPPNNIMAKPNEKVNLEYYIGNCDGISEYAAILLLDWAQIKINDNSTLFVKISEGLSNDDFTITAPSEPGRYDVAAIFVPNPFNNIPVRSFDMLQYTYRFTITVK